MEAGIEPKRRRWRLGSGERRLLLILGDLIAAAAATFLALYFWAQFDWLGFSPGFVRYRAGWFVLLPILWLLLMINNYDVIRAASWRESLRGVLISGLGGVFLYLIVYFTSEPGSLPRRGVLYFLVLAVLLTLVWRWIYVRIFTAPGFMRRVLVVGAGDSGKTLLEVYRSVSPPPFNLVGLIDDDPSKLGRQVEGYPVIGGSQDLLEAIEREEITDIIVSILGPMRGEMFQALLDAQERGVVITRMPVAYEELLGRLETVLNRSLLPIEVLIPYQAGELVNLWHTCGLIEEEEHTSEGVRLKGMLPRQIWGRFEPFRSVQE